jgi:hypothetical protein
MFERPHVTKIPENVDFKWFGRTLDEGFVPFPKRLLRCLNRCFEGKHAVTDLMAVLAIVDYRRPRQPHPPSLEFLAFTAGMSVDQFEDSLARMKSRSMLDYEGTETHLDVDLSLLLQKVEELTADKDSDVDDDEEDGWDE